MTPTNQLRFVLRRNTLAEARVDGAKTYRILQQLWTSPGNFGTVPSTPGKQEWRDVPIEVEP
jgi:hypothetical protein